MTDADVLRDCAALLRACADQLAKRRGSIDHDHCRLDLDYAIAGVADGVTVLEQDARMLDERDRDDSAEIAEEQGRWRRVG